MALVHGRILSQLFSFFSVGLLFNQSVGWENIHHAVIYLSGLIFGLYIGTRRRVQRIAEDKKGPRETNP